MSYSFERLHTKPVYLLLIVFLSAFLCFWNLGEHSLEEWDEARYGVNALEMIERGDYVNYYYEKQPDQWNAKPPLSVWFIVLSYKIFGFNEFALRFSSALAGVLIFVILFQIVSYYRPLSFSLFTCLILMGTTAIIGGHVARNGDMDAPFVLFNLLFIYYFIRYLNEDKNYIFSAVIFLGLSFYTKGPAFLLIIPGIVMFLLLRGRFFILLRKWKIWLAVLLFLSIVISWNIILHFYGNTFETPQFMGNNSWQTMWVYDIFGRFLDYKFNEQEMPGQYNFIITNLDVKFNLWNYIFYLAIIVLFIKYRKNFEALKKNEILILALCLVISISFLLTFSQNKRPWYIALMMPFVAIITAEGISMIRKYAYTRYVFILLLGFTLSRQFVNINTINKDRGHFIKNYKEEMNNCKTLFISPELTQDIKLYAYWYNKNVELLDKGFTMNSGNCYLLNEERNVSSHKKDCRGNLCLYIPLAD